MSQNKSESSPVLIPFAIFCVFGIVGCATPIHISDTYDTKSGAQTLAIDAKQRVVIFTKQRDPSDPENAITVTCAEPSPDALSALSSSLGGGAQTNAGIIANLAMAASESAASIGLRTQSIQLLRDGMYRLCEAYAAQAITSDEFYRQERRYQNLMLSLLAIEQITGAVVPRQVGLGNGASSASVGEGANAAAADAAKADQAVVDAQSALTASNNTLISDKNACAAVSPPDPTNTICVKAAKTDADDVTAKTTDLHTAQMKQATAQDALKAARSAVRAAATGASVSFSDATKTLQLTDASARYVTEAARTIVSTTLLASFTQEECARLWDHLTPIVAASTTVTTPDNTSTKIIPKHRAPLKETLGTLGFTPEETKEEAKTLLRSLLSNCRNSQQAMLNQAAMFTPQYGTSTPPPLSVLVTDKALSIAPGDAPLDLGIVGGVPPYRPSVTAAFNLKNELYAAIAPPKGMAYLLHIERPKGATQEGAATIFVVDATNAHFDILVSLTAPKKPVASTTSALAAPANVKATSAAGKITVTFDPPTATNVIAYKASATNANAAKSETHSSAGKPTDKSIVIPQCTSGDTYNISVEVSDAVGEIKVGKATDPVKCSAVAPPATKPAAPTKLRATSAAGSITVTFSAPKDGGRPVTGYTAIATNTDAAKGEKPLSAEAKETETSVSISGCTVGNSYAVTVVAKRKSGEGQAGKVSKSVKCSK